MAIDNLTRPEKSLHLKDSDLTFTMTYVVLNDILRFVGGVEEAMVSMMTNQDVRDMILRRLMTDSKKPIQSEDDLIPLGEVDIDIFEIEDTMGWVLDHVTYFFMKLASRMNDAAKRYPETLQAMMMTSSDLSETGSNPSQTATKSAGPTE